MKPFRLPGHWWVRLVLAIYLFHAVGGGLPLAEDSPFFEVTTDAEPYLLDIRLFR